MILIWEKNLRRGGIAVVLEAVLGLLNGPQVS